MSALGNDGSSIIDQTLDTLASQADAQQVQQLNNSFTFNPSVFQPAQPENATPRQFQDFRSGDPRFLVLGPYRFDRRFAKPPQMIFGQMGTVLNNAGDSPIVIGIPNTYVPFLVDANPYQWVYANGEVDGFYVELYALTVPPLGLVEHTLNWIAIGQASRYTTSDSDQAWTDSYDYNQADYMNSDLSGTPDEELDNEDDFT